MVRLKELVADKEQNGEQDKLAAKAVDQVAMKEGEGKADASPNKNQQVILHHDHHHQQQPPIRPQSRKIVKGPILLYVSLSGLSVLLISSCKKVCRAAGNGQNFAWSIHCQSSRKAVPAHFIGGREGRG